MKNPLENGVYVCIECGEAFTERNGPGSLEAHWYEWGHGPTRVQLDAIDRAKAVFEPVPDDDPA